MLRVADCAGDRKQEKLKQGLEYSVHLKQRARDERKLLLDARVGRKHD